MRSNDNKKLAEFCNQINRQRPQRQRDWSGTSAFLIGALCILVGIALIAGGIYVGIWTMLIGGIVQVIDAAKLTPTDSHGVAIGVAKALFCSVPIWLGFVMGFFSIKCAFSR